MAEFHTEHLDELTRQLAFVPPKRRSQQIDNAEQLFWHIEDDRNYPLEFLTYRITGYRPDTVDDITLVGRAVRHDLLILVERLSDTLDAAFDDFQPRPYDLDALAAKLNVTAKTISRYRLNGLFARQLVGPTGRKKLGFHPESVDRFLASRSPKMKRAAAFSRMDEPTRHRIVTRARRITTRVETSPFRVAQHLATKVNRSPEAIRRLLIDHDKRDPRVAIFPEHTPPLTEKQQRVIYRAYQRGVTVSRLAEHFSKARNAIYRAINKRRAIALHAIHIQHVSSYTFHLPDAERVILGSQLPDISQPSQQDIPPSDTPDLEAPIESNLLDADTERALFARYNFLKYLAAQFRKRLDSYQPGSQQIDRIETYLRHAVAIKHQIVKANQGLVISAARRHLDLTQGGYPNPHALADWISEGNLTLLQAIETFDPGKGNRFSTYLTWAMMRRFAQATRKDIAAGTTGRTKEKLSETNSDQPNAKDNRPRFMAINESMDLAPANDWAAAMNPQLTQQDHAQEVEQTLQTLLSHLDDRERFILTRHFGLLGATSNDPTSSPSEKQDNTTELAPQTLAQIAEHLNISAERARQIEHRALGKLRTIASELDLEMPITDILSS